MTGGKCKEPGCLGVIEIGTDGNGRTVDRCQCCERRREWQRKHLPVPPPQVVRCEICSGEIPRPTRGKAARHCKLCGKLYARFAKLHPTPKATRATVRILPAERTA